MVNRPETSIRWTKSDLVLWHATCNIVPGCFYPETLPVLRYSVSAGDLPMRKLYSCCSVLFCCDHVSMCSSERQCVHVHQAEFCRKQQEYSEYLRQCFRLHSLPVKTYQLQSLPDFSLGLVDRPTGLIFSVRNDAPIQKAHRPGWCRFFIEHSWIYITEPSSDQSGENSSAYRTIAASSCAVAYWNAWPRHISWVNRLTKLVCLTILKRAGVYEQCVLLAAANIVNSIYYQSHKSNLELKEKFSGPYCY